MAVIIGVLCLVIVYISLMFGDEFGGEWWDHPVRYSFLAVGLFLLSFSIVINKGELVYGKEEISLYSMFNSSEQNVHGSLFYTTTNNKDYLIYWTEESGNFKKRNKLEINWGMVEVYENNSETPRIERWWKWYDGTSKFWDLERGTKRLYRIKIFVPENTVISHITLE